MNVEEELRAIVATKVKAPLVESTKLADAGLDSLDVIEIAFDIEDKFNIQLPQMGSEMLSVTLGDLCRLVEKELQAKGNAARMAPATGTAASS
jgi:acyl carrier protein